MKAHINALDSMRTQATVRVVAARRITPVIQFHLKTRQLILLVRLDEERSLARGMAPTCYGEILIRHARRALSEFGFARDEIVALKSGLSGKAAIGTVLSPGTHLVPAVIVRMKQRHPGVITSVEIGSSRTLVQKLVRGELDMVVGRVLDSAPKDELVYEPLAPDERLAVIASATHPLARRQELQLGQLLDEPWILPPAGSLVRDRLAEMLVQQGCSLPANIVESQCLPVITALLQQSNMLTVLPEEAVQSYCKAGLLTVLVRDLPLGVGPFGLITCRQHELSPAAHLMLNAIRKQAEHPYPVQCQRPTGARLSLV